ncbi:MAG TPA: zf-HC2 domain-containing protein [Chroococcales cyanobacterium]|jgi:anti-sigma factor RsiW
MERDCTWVQERISFYADGILEVDEERLLHSHLRGCADCAATLADLLRTVHLLGHLPELEPTGDPWGGIAFRLRRAGFQKKRMLARAGSMAAAALLGIAGLTYALSAFLTPPQADLDAYWREHAIFTAQGIPLTVGPNVVAIEATYRMQKE